MVAVFVPVTVTAIAAALITVPHCFQGQELAACLRHRVLLFEERLRRHGRDIEKNVR